MSLVFYLLLALTAVLATTASAGEPISDINGDFIFDGSYYVLPVFRGGGGGLTLYGRGDGNLCPLDIVQEKSEVNNGIPIRFSGWISRVGFVPESTNLNIKTDVAGTYCRQLPYWRIDEFDTERNKLFVTTGSIPEGLGEFQIKYAGSRGVYKFAYCKGKCVDVGIFVDEKGVRRLALSSNPFLVMFKKANVEVTEGSSKTM